MEGRKNLRQSEANIYATKQVEDQIDEILANELRDEMETAL